MIARFATFSETGAALEVVTPLFIPDRFTPIVQSEQLKGPCHIVWRKEKRMGVAFDRWARFQTGLIVGGVAAPKPRPK